MKFTITNPRSCGHALSAQYDIDARRMLLDTPYLVMVVGTMIKRMFDAERERCRKCIDVLKSEVEAHG